MAERTHQLVVQFPSDAFVNFDAVVSFEDSLYQLLGDRHEVDGHDIGSGEVNFFVSTDDPRSAFADIQSGLRTRLSHPLARAATRHVDDDEYELLWPLGDTRTFTIE